jgi:DnaJ like chaperone protein
MWIVLFLVLVYLFYDFLKLKTKGFYGLDIFYDKWFNRQKVSKEFLLLTAYVMTIEGKPNPKAFSFVFWFIEKNYGKKELVRIKNHLKFYTTKKIKIKRALHKIDYEQTQQTKIQILNYLIKISTIDRMLSNAELAALKEICSGFSLSHQILKSLLATHSFVFEGRHQKDGQQKTYQKGTKKSHTSKLKIAFATLGLDSDATTHEIKKTYRKMMLIYHPDKITHLDASFKASAKEKFLKINEAYEYLKKELKFK